MISDWNFLGSRFKLLLSFLPFFLRWKISKLGDLVRNDDDDYNDYDDENLVCTWVGSWVQAMERMIYWRACPES